MTIPPCIENVNWILQIEPLKITRRNLQRFKTFINNGQRNNRQQHRLNDRPVFLIGDECSS